MKEPRSPPTHAQPDTHTPITEFLTYPRCSMRSKSKASLPSSGARVLTSAQSLALIEEKQKKKREEEEAKQKRKEERAIRKAKQEEEKMRKAEERAKKAAERQKKAAEKEELKLQKMKTRKGKRAKISGDTSTVFNPTKFPQMNVQFVLVHTKRILMKVKNQYVIGFNAHPLNAPSGCMKNVWRRMKMNV